MVLGKKKKTKQDNKKIIFYKQVSEQEMDIVLAGLFQPNMENMAHFGNDVLWLLTSRATVTQYF